LCTQGLEAYYALLDAYLQYTPGGEMNMEIVLGLAYAKNENYVKAVETLENFTNSHQSKYEIGFFDYHVLGVLYVHNKQ
jgi:outer membrane protein assembly factor BamD (BamD/ComL family)